MVDLILWIISDVPSSTAGRNLGSFFILCVCVCVIHVICMQSYMFVCFTISYILTPREAAFWLHGWLLVPVISYNVQTRLITIALFFGRRREIAQCRTFFGKALHKTKAAEYQTPLPARSLCLGVCEGEVWTETALTQCFYSILVGGDGQTKTTHPRPWTQTQTHT